MSTPGRRRVAADSAVAWLDLEQPPPDVAAGDGGVAAVATQLPLGVMTGQAMDDETYELSPLQEVLLRWNLVY